MLRITLDEKSNQFHTTKLARVRTEIVGLSTIQSYCKNKEDLQEVLKLPFIVTSTQPISSQLLMHRMKTSTIFFTVIFSTLRVIVYVTLKLGGILLEALFYFPWNQFFCMVGLIDDLWNVIGRSNWFSKENRILHNRYLRYCYMECILI